VAAGAILVAWALAVGACCGSTGSGGGGASEGPSSTLRVSLTDTGCLPATLDAIAGHITFSVANNKSSKATSFVVRDEQGDTVASAYNVLGGLTHSVSANMTVGRYTMECGGHGAGGTGAVTIREPLGK
jgi:iron uptake system component EfeO